MKFFVPGSWALLLLGTASGVGAVLVRRTLWPWALGCILAFGAAYLILSLPRTSRALVYMFPRYEQLHEVARVTAVTTFGGDHEDGRVEETGRLFALLHSDWVIVSGEEQLRDAIVAAGIPRERVLWDPRSTNTREQALAVHRLAADHRIDAMVLVASPIHMPRALRACRAAGLRVVPSPSAMPHADLPRQGAASVTPRAEALWFSSESIYEYLALVYYWAAGWLAPLTP